MDLNMLLGSYAFPVVACIFMAMYVKETTENYRKDVKDLQESHKSELSAFKSEVLTALNNNTVAIIKLTEKLKGDDKIEIN